MPDNLDTWRTPRLETLSVGLDTAIDTGSNTDLSGGSNLAPG